jgi:hypothetical protein
MLFQAAWMSLQTPTGHFPNTPLPCWCENNFDLSPFWCYELLAGRECCVIYLYTFNVLPIPGSLVNILLTHQFTNSPVCDLRKTCGSFSLFWMCRLCACIFSQRSMSFHLELSRQNMLLLFQLVSPMRLTLHHTDVTVPCSRPVPPPASVCFSESRGISVHYPLLEQMDFSLTKFNVGIKIRNATNWGI